MNVGTFSPALTMLFVYALLWILMGIRFSELSRLQKWLSCALVLLLCAMNQFLLRMLGSASYTKLIFFTMHLPYFLIFLRLAKCGPIKAAFMILSAVVFTAPSVHISNFVKSVFASSWALLVSNLLTYAAVLLLAHFVFRKSFNYLIKYGDDAFFVRFSVVPLLYYVYFLAAMNLNFSALNPPGGYVVRLMPTLYVFIFYFLLLRNYKELDERRELETARATLHQQLAAAGEQIELLNKAQSEVAVHQHNMRHHLAAIDAFLSAENTRQAREYIKAVQNDVDAITPKRFCENELVNLLCSSFAQKAERQRLRLTVEAKLPRRLSVSDTELCSVLSNGLENALRAAFALEQSGRWTELYCGVRANKLLIEIKNPYRGKVVMQNGLPLSGREGHGYGCRSIQTIVEHNKGLCAFEAEDGIFTLRVVLPLKEIGESE